MSNGVGRGLYSARQLTSQSCEARMLLYAMCQEMLASEKHQGLRLSLSLAATVRSLLPGQGCGSDGNLTWCIRDDQVLGWAFTMHCNPEKKYTEVFTHTWYDCFTGSDNVEHLFPSERPSRFEGHLGRVGYITTYHGPLCGSRRKNLSWQLFAYTYSMRCVWRFYFKLPTIFFLFFVFLVLRV